MFGLTLIMTALLGYQVMMPQVNNAKYAFSIDKDGNIVRMNTQDGSFQYCNKETFKCEENKNE